MLVKSADVDKKVLTTERLEIRGKTLIFDNSIYQIMNVSAVEVGTIAQSLSIFFWVALVIGVGGIFANSIGAVLIGFAVAIALYVFQKSNQRYGLILRLNSGFSQLIVSNNQDFLKDVAVVLRNVMDNEEGRSISFNLDQRKIVDNVSGSTVVLGDSTGDIVNRV